MADERSERGQQPAEEQQGGRLAVVDIATVVTILAIVFFVEDIARQPVLVTSLASSAFLLYYQPLNEFNRFKPLVLGHLLAAGVGYVASQTLPLPYIAAAVGIAATVVLMSLLRIIYPAAVSTSLVFSYRPHDVSALTTFVMTLVVVVLLGLLYFMLRRDIHPSRFIRYLRQGTERGSS